MISRVVVVGEGGGGRKGACITSPAVAHDDSIRMIASFQFVSRVVFNLTQQVFTLEHVSRAAAAAASLVIAPSDVVLS